MLAQAASAQISAVAIEDLVRLSAIIAAAVDKCGCA
jgi:hypothetical protein